MVNRNDLPVLQDTLHLSSSPWSTKWYRLRGRPTKREHAVKQQYLSAREKKLFARLVLQMSNSNFLGPFKFLRSLARDSVAMLRVAHARPSAADQIA